MHEQNLRSVGTLSTSLPTNKMLNFSSYSSTDLGFASVLEQPVKIASAPQFSLVKQRIGNINDVTTTGTSVKDTPQTSNEQDPSSLNIVAGSTGSTDVRDISEVHNEKVSLSPGIEDANNISSCSTTSASAAQLSGLSLSLSSRATAPSLVTNRIDVTNNVNGSRSARTSVIQPSPQIRNDPDSSSLALSSLITSPCRTMNPVRTTTDSVLPIERTLEWTVFWDIENVPVSKTHNGAQVTRAIVHTLMHIRNHQHAIDSVRRIIVFVNTAKLISTLRNELQSNGVLLYHVDTRHRKDAADKCLITELCLSVRDLRPPAGICIMSGDQDFAYTLSCIRALGFTTAVIAPHISCCSPLLTNVPHYVKSFEKDVLKDVLPSKLSNVDKEQQNRNTNKSKKSPKIRKTRKNFGARRNVPDRIRLEQSASGDSQTVNNACSQNIVTLIRICVSCIASKVLKRALLSIALVSAITISSCMLLATIVRNQVVRNAIHESLLFFGSRLSPELLLMIFVAFPLNIIALLYFQSTVFFSSESAQISTLSQSPQKPRPRFAPRGPRFQGRSSKKKGPTSTLKNPPNL